MNVSVVESRNNELGLRIDNPGSWPDPTFCIRIGADRNYLAADNRDRSGRRLRRANRMNICVTNDQVCGLPNYANGANRSQDRYEGGFENYHKVELSDLCEIGLPALFVLRNDRLECVPICQQSGLAVFCPFFERQHQLSLVIRLEHIVIAVTLEIKHRLVSLNLNKTKKIF